MAILIIGGFSRSAGNTVGSNSRRRRPVCIRQHFFLICSLFTSLFLHLRIQQFTINWVLFFVNVNRRHTQTCPWSPVYLEANDQHYSIYHRLSPVPQPSLDRLPVSELLLTSFRSIVTETIGRTNGQKFGVTNYDP